MQTALLIDPDEASREALAQIIGTDYQVRSVPSLEDALIQVRLEPPAVILTELPEKALEHLYRLRHTWPHVPILVVTDHPDLSLAVEAMKLGVVDYLPKPVSASRLWEALGQAHRQTAGDVPNRFERSQTPVDDLTLRGLAGSFEALREFNLALSSAQDLADWAQCVKKTLISFFEASSLEIFIAEEEGFRQIGNSGNVPATHPIVAYLARTRAPLCLRDLARREIGPRSAWRPLEKYHLLVPLCDESTLLGFWGLGVRRSRQAYSAFDLEMAFTFATLGVPWLKLHLPAFAAALPPRSLLAILEQLPRPALLLDASQTIIFATQRMQELTGHPDLVGHTPHVLGSAFAERLSAESSEEGPCKIQRADGTDLDLTLETVKLPGDRLWVTFSDPYDFQAARRRLQEKLSAWPSVISEVSHHVRNALMPIQTLLELAHESGPELAEIRQAASGAVERLQTFLTGLELFSRVEKNPPQYVDVNILLAKAIATIKRELSVEGRLNVQYTDPLPSIPADRQQLQKGFERLLQHGLEHLPEGEGLHLLTSLEESPQGERWIRVLVAYTAPTSEWDRQQAAHWDLTLATVAQMILEHGGVFETRATPDRIEHEIRFVSP